MKKIIYSFVVLFLAFMAMGITAQAQTKKAYVVKGGTTLFETAITNIDSILFAPATFYTVTYHANGESVTVPAAKKALAGSKVNIGELSGYDPETSPKIFHGWNTKNNGSGILYCPGYPLTVTGNMDLYAEWTVRPAETIPEDGYAITLKHYEDPVILSYCMRGIYPGVLSKGKIEENDYYNINYSFTTNVPIDYLYLSLADASMELSDDIRVLSNASVLKNIPANTVISGTITNHQSHHSAPNEAAIANCISFLVLYPDEASSLQTALTFTKLEVTKADVPTLTNVTADGGDGRATTQFMLVFDRVVGITIDDIQFASAGSTNITKKSLTSLGGGIYVLKVTMPIVLTEHNDDYLLTVYIKNGGSVIAGAQTVMVHLGETDPEPEPVSPIYVTQVRADGDPFTTTTAIFITFSEQVPGLTAADITLTGITVKKGVLSSPVVNPTFNTWTYTLPISNFTTERATLSVSIVPEKSGREIEHKVYKTVNIYYFLKGEENYDNIIYTGYLGRGYDVLNSPYYRGDKVKTPYALNMKKLIAEDKVRVKIEGGTNAIYITGESLSKYAKDFSFKASAKASVGFFSASASFGYSTSSSVETKESFASVRCEITRYKHNMDPISLADFREKYLDDLFKNEWLLNPSVSPATLFQNYGTHIFLQLYTGGRMEMNYVCHEEDYKNSSTLETSVKASYMTVSGSASTTEKKTSEEFRKNCSETVESIGGTTAYNFSSFDAAMTNYERWTNSVTNGVNLQLVKGGDLNSVTEMIPIWELVSADPTNPRRKAINDAYDKMLADNGYFIMGLQKANVPTHILGVYMGYDNGNNNLAVADLKSMAPGASMNVVDGNLSSGRKAVRRIGYTETTNAGWGITDIKAVYGTDLPATKEINGKTYHRFGYTLGKNKNNSLYACWVEDSPGVAPLKDIYVSINGELEGVQGTGWERVTWTDGTKADMNKDAGADTVHLWIKR